MQLRRWHLFVSLALTLGLSNVSQATDSYLYWMVDENSSASIDFDCAKVSYSDGSSSGFLNLFYGFDDLTAKDSIDNYYISDSFGTGLGFYASLGLNTPDSISYAIELYNADVLVASSVPLYCGETAFASYVSRGGISAPSSMWQPILYAAPEPNTSLLVLIGISLLALIRPRDIFVEELCAI